MKVVSRESLLGSMLAFAVVVYMVITYDEVMNLLWIALFGYIGVKSAITAFSREAYDEGRKEEQQQRVLYRDLFGPMAYIAADVPLGLILIAYLTVVFRPVTSISKAVMLILMLAALAYVIWMRWYVEKHKKLRKESGEWENGVLTPDEEKAWKRSATWHTVILCALAILVIVFTR